MSESTPTRRFFSGTSLERAVLEAAGHYGLEPDQLAYTRREKRGVASRGKVVVCVDPAQPRRVEASEGDQLADAAPKSEPTSPADEGIEAASQPEQPVQEVEVVPEEAPETAPALEEAPETVPEPEEVPEASPEPEESASANQAGEAQGDPVEASAGTPEPGIRELPRSSAEARRGWQQASGPVEQAARRWTESLLRVASLDLEVEIYDRNNELEVHLGGADSEVAVEDGGEVLRAIQHLLPRLLLGTVGESVPCRVDCNDFRELHEERLRTQALRAAAETLASGGEVTLDPMHPADRRIIHLALADNELLRTESLGRGFFKRVSIRRA